ARHRAGGAERTGRVPGRRRGGGHGPRAGGGDRNPADARHRRPRAERLPGWRLRGDLTTSTEKGEQLMRKPFASSADLEEKTETLEVLADGVYALTAEGDPNVGAIEGEDFLVAFEARATPVMARRWLDRLREHTDKPVRFLVLSHYHAVRVLGAAAFDADVIVAHEQTRRLIAERGEEDWASERARMPRLFTGEESIPGLTWPDVTFTDRLTIHLGGDRGQVVLQYCG